MLLCCLRRGIVSGTLTQKLAVIGTGRASYVLTVKAAQLGMQMGKGRTLLNTSFQTRHLVSEPAKNYETVKETSKELATAPVIWTDVASEPVLTGTIIPFAQQNVIQWLIFPYTYAVMYYMDFLVGHMPWWAAIAATTLTCKIIFFPLAIKQQIVTIKMNNLAPETQQLQVKINEAQISGDAYQVALNKTKLKLLHTEHGLSVMQRLWPGLVQAPMFMSVFFLLRNLTGVPVESLQTGGISWFQNLTLPDPYMILPVITCLTMLGTIELSIRTAGVSSIGPVGKWMMRSMSLGLFAFIYNFPAALLVFWTTNNVLSLVTTLILRSKPVSKKVGIPERIEHDPASLPLSNTSLLGQIKNAKDMGQKSRTSLDIRRLDDIAFKKAGVGPLRKTYTSPPPSSRQ